MLALLAATLIRQSDSIQIREALVIEGVSRGGRVPFSTDSVQKAVVEGTWSAPKEGDTLGSSKWVNFVAKADGNIEPSSPGGAYAYTTVESPDDHVALLTAVGHGMVYVNGAPRAGDPYGYGYVTIPVDMHK